LACIVAPNCTPHVTASCTFWFVVGSAMTAGVYSSRVLYVAAYVLQSPPEMSLMGTFLAPRQSTRDCGVALADEDDVEDVVEDVVEDLLVVEDIVELTELPQVPNCGWQPVPQYALVVPHQPDLSARLITKYENDNLPYCEQQEPKELPRQVTPLPHEPSVVTFRVGVEEAEEEVLLEVVVEVLEEVVVEVLEEVLEVVGFEDVDVVDVFDDDEEEDVQTPKAD
jgi:hypothetical protein